MKKDRNISLMNLILRSNSISELEGFLSSLDLTFKPLDNSYTNGSIILNQTASPLKAITELITNSFDAIIEKRSSEYHIDINQPLLGDDVIIAREKILGYQKLSDLSQERIEEYANQLKIITQNGPDCPNYLIIDEGIGVPYDKLESSFLRLSKSNKISRLLHGMYGYGGSASLPFTKGGYKAIISKYYKGNDVCVILIRKHNLSDDDISHKLGWYEYAVWADNNQIPSFTLSDDESIEVSDDLNIYFKSGTIIKLFEYAHLKGIKSLGLSKLLNLELIDPCLPIKVIDTVYSQRSEILSSNICRLSKPGITKFNRNYKITFDALKGSYINIDAYVTNREYLHADYIGTGKGISFLLSGISQFDLPSSYISQELGFSALRENLVLYIDCSFLSSAQKEELFMGSRDRYRESTFLDDIIEMIVSMLKKDPDLIALNEEYRVNPSTTSNTDDMKKLKEIFSKIPTNYRSCFMSPSGSFKAPKLVPKKVEQTTLSKENKLLLEYPSYFNAKTSTILEINPQRFFSLKIDSDARQDFLTRIQNPGRIEVNAHQILPYSRDITHMVDTSISEPINGVFNIGIRFSDAHELADSTLKLTVSCISPLQTFSINFLLFTTIQSKKCIDSIRVKQQEKLPEAVRVYKDSNNTNSWVHTHMDSTKTITVTVNNCQLEKVLINMDSDVLMDIIANSNLPADRIKNDYFYTVYLSTLALYNSILNSIPKTKILEDSNETIVKELVEKLPELITNIFAEYAVAAYTIKTI